ncbi:MAG: MG2 domain-containing protein [Planctomycetota bacterium]
MLSGKPWPGVRLLVSNGREVIGEAVTDKDGVFQKSYKNLVTAEGKPLAASQGPLNSSDIRVFAAIENNVASNMLNLQGVGVAQGLTDKGYIYTDRPAYRAGQLVNVRGCLRRAADDVYAIDKDKSYTVDVFDARNRPICQEKVKLNAFGSFHAHFVLPPNSPQGQYRVLVHDNGSQNFQGTFLVHEYQLEPIRLVVDTPRRVYYRGEPIEGAIRAEFYYGAPVVGREIRYQLAGDRMLTATTNAKGEVPINLPTREYSESQILPLTVQLPEGNVNAQVNFVLAAQGFSVGVSTVRPVYVTGESLETTVNVRDAENKPLAQKLKLKVLERTLVAGRPGERLVEEHELTTAADGKARQTIKLDKGGTYFLRAEAVDRFHNPITGQASLQISGEDDLVRLRILANLHTYKVGDTAAVQLHWRDAPALALVTYQGARVLDYRLVELKTGANKLEIPMTATLAPNFELAVAVMTDPRPDLGSDNIVGWTSESVQIPATDLEIHPQGTRTDSEVHPTGPAKPQVGKKVESKPRPIVRFHTSTSPFTVERDLRVKIATKRKSPNPLLEGNPLTPALSQKEKGDSVRPGDELEVTVTTTDPQGKPVAAELSLAMVEQSLLDRFASPLPSIGDFFRGTQREPAVRCTSSIMFSYRPATQPINPRLLAEKDREEIANEEAESSKAAIALTRTTADGTVLSLSDLPLMVQAEESQTGRLMFGVGVNSDAGLVENVTLDEQNFDRKVYPVADLVLPIKQSGFSGLQLNGGNTYTGGTNITAGDLNGLIAQNQRQVLVVDNSGKFRNVRLGDNGRLDDKRAAAMAAEFNASGAILLSALLPQETGYWNPVVTTGADGTATVTLTVPERSTAWKFLAKGISTETLAGEASNDLTVKKDLFGEIKLPLAFTDGDTAEIPVTVHNNAVDKGPIEVVLRTTIAGRKVEETKTIEVASKGLQEVSFKVELLRSFLPKGGGNDNNSTDPTDPSARPFWKTGLA